VHTFRRYTIYMMRSRRGGVISVHFLFLCISMGDLFFCLRSTPPGGVTMCAVCVFLRNGKAAVADHRDHCLPSSSSVCMVHTRGLP